MPSSFNVVSLGNLADLDTVEGNTLAENAGALVGTTFGGINNSLVNDFVAFTPGSVSYTGGSSTTAYDQDGANAETFQIDGGAEQVFDSSVVYNATITYIDGTTATITAVVFQDTAGNTYWAPEFSANADMTAMQAAPIRSLSLNSVAGDTYSGMTGIRENWSFAVCFTSGTRIFTADGDKPIEDIRIGDLVRTKDNGMQPVRWIGNVTRWMPPNLRPIKFQKGALGACLPERDLMVSPQHRMLVHNVIAKRVCGSEEALVAAKKLLPIDGVSIAHDRHIVTYIHLMFDQHEVIYAEGTPSESLYLGQEARRALSQDALEEVLTLFPELESAEPKTMYNIPEPRQQAKIAQRLSRNDKPAIDIIPTSELALLH